MKIFRLKIVVTDEEDYFTFMQEFMQIKKEVNFLYEFDDEEDNNKRNAKKDNMKTFVAESGVVETHGAIFENKKNIIEQDITKEQIHSPEPMSTKIDKNEGYSLDINSHEKTVSDNLQAVESGKLHDSSSRDAGFDALANSTESVPGSNSEELEELETKENTHKNLINTLEEYTHGQVINLPHGVFKNYIDEDTNNQCDGEVSWNEGLEGFVCDKCRLYTGVK